MRGAPRLARVPLDTAAGDGTAREIVGRHGGVLGEYALVAARRVGLGATLRGGGSESVVGAALLAPRAAHGGDEADLHSWRVVLAASLPPATLFRT